MKPVLTARQMLAADSAAIAAGTSSPVLMERAARGVMKVLQAEFDTGGTVAIFCGPGNNGGDGFLLARLLFGAGVRAAVCYPGKTSGGNARPVADLGAMSEGAAREYQKLPPEIPVFFTPDFLKTDEAGAVSAAVDAMFGVGLTRPVEGRFADCVQALNESSIPVLALDIPTGISADTGAVLGCAVKATGTVAISHLKRGHLLFPGAEFCGKLCVSDIGVRAPDPAFYLSEPGDLAALPPRPVRSNKGTFGRILIVGGSVGMSGAGYLAAKAAYRAGAGLVEILTPARNRTIYQKQLPEAVLNLYPEKKPDAAALSAALSRASSVALGMGLSTAPAAVELTACTLREAPGRLPLVIDADALNILAAKPELLALLKGRARKAILTPHPGEMARLCQNSIAEILADPVRVAADFARMHGVVVVLKDAHTVVTDGEAVFLNDAGNNGMATAGSGDVLAGVIAAFAAVCESSLTAARLGVLAHAMAGDAAAEKFGNRGLMASDIADGLCTVLKPII